jgi:hypothetical protein
VAARESGRERTPRGLVEVFPGVRIDRAAGVVEFDGTVPIDAHDPKTPLVYLEMFVCGPDSHEHESLVVTRARPSLVHAALLMLGVEAGSPGAWGWKERTLGTIPPTGTALKVSFRWKDAHGVEREAPAASWVVLHPKGGALTRWPRAALWRFGGSKIVRRSGRDYYDADMTGRLVGLTTFGGETIGWHQVLSPEASVQEPEWIADARVVPAYGTPVTVVVRVVRGGRR